MPGYCHVLIKLDIIASDNENLKSSVKVFTEHVKMVNILRSKGQCTKGHKNCIRKC